MWIFPSFETARIAWDAAVGVKVAYDAACHKIDALGVQSICLLTTGVLEGNAVLIFRWEPGVDARSQAIVDAIALLVGGAAYPT
jgi:hypothetical protein